MADKIYDFSTNKLYKCVLGVSHFNNGIRKSLVFSWLVGWFTPPLRKDGGPA